MKISLLVSVVVVFLSGAAAFGQYWGGAYVNNKASTVGESYARGMSDVIRSQGVANLANSQAAINVQQAESAYLDNRLKYTQTYFENRKLNREYRAAEAGPKITEQQAEQIARARAPQRATAKDIDPVTGGLEWPMVLNTPEFAESRAKLDQLFAERAKQEGAIGMDTFNEILATTDEMLATLKENITSYPPATYMQGKQFIERISTSAQFPTG